jgi:hypothetical protein
VSPHLSNGTFLLLPTFSLSVRSPHDNSRSLKSAAHHGVVITLSLQVSTFTGQYGPSPVLLPFSYSGVLISGPRQRATLSIEHRRVRFSSSLTHFHSFPTYSDTYQSQARRPFHKRVQFDEFSLSFLFSFVNPLFHSHFLLTTRCTRLPRVLHCSHLPST